jgi:hypothetical protein
VTVGQARVAPRYRETMLRLASEIDELAPAQQAELHFALGAVFERDGHHDAAFAHLRAANAITRASTVYDEAAELSFLRASQSAFASPVMDSLRDCGERSERPVFIFGLPRSGSTLVEQLLAAHPAVDTAGELGILGGIVRSVWDGLAASTLAGLRAGVRRIGERYLAETDSLAGGGTRLTDKTLYNVGFAPFIHVTLPNARMIHVRRNPLDTCISCYATLFAPLQVSYSYDLGELGRYYRASTEMIEAVRPFIAPDRLLEVVYEELIDDFEAQARRIVAFCGLLWDPACLNFHAVRRPVLTASSAQVRQPLYRDSLGRAAPFLPHLGPLVAALGGSS